MNKFVTACLAAIAAAEGTGDLTFTSIGQFKQKQAAFIQVRNFEGIDGVDDSDFLLVTEFSGSPLSNGSVSIIPGVKDAVKAGDVSSLEGAKLDTGKIKF